MINSNAPIYSSLLLLVALSSASAQETASTPTAPAVIRTESRVVLVDAVVTDKKGNYIRDLKQKDFKVWEDNKEQTINSFTFEAAPASPANDRKHYLVLFFDNSSSSPQDQMHAREAATRFIDSNAGPNRLMAVVEFAGGLRVSQNFTDDADRLKKVVNGVKNSPLSTTGGPYALRSFAQRSVLLALRDLAKGLSDVPGRKTLIFISGGFPLNQEGYTELTATIDACNRANVAVYPIDVHGLIAPGAMLFHPVEAVLAGIAAVRDALDPAAHLPRAYFQKKGGGGGGGGNSGMNGTLGASSPSPSRGGGGRAPGIMPPMIGATNQQVLYALASGTGGFVIVNTNDLLTGFEKIGKEQNEFYLLGYTPSKELEPGACHTLKVKVDQSGTTVRARSGYCDVKPKDILAGTPTERDLETRVNGGAAPNINATMQAPWVYTGPGVSRVNMAIDMPGNALVFNKEKGKLHMALNIIGIVSFPDGGIAARFSDTVKIDFEDKKEVDAFHQRLFHYEKQFEVASGKYTLKVAFSSGGESFGKLELPLSVDSYESNQFTMSSLVLSKQARSVDAGGGGADAVMQQDRVPLIVNGIQVIPAGTNHFKKTERGFVYGEIYEPAFLASEIKEPLALGVQMQLVEKATRTLKFDSGLVRVEAKPIPGNATVPFGLRMDFTNLAPGLYQVLVMGADADGHKFTRGVDLELEP